MHEQQMMERKDKKHKQLLRVECLKCAIECKKASGEKIYKILSLSETFLDYVRNGTLTNEGVTKAENLDEMLEKLDKK